MADFLHRAFNGLNGLSHTIMVSEEQIRAELGSVCQVVRLREFRFDQTAGVPVRFLGWSCLLRRS